MEPFEFAEEWERQWDEMLVRLPECSGCGRRIADSRYFQYEDICLCRSCLTDCMCEAEW